MIFIKGTLFTRIENWLRSTGVEPVISTAYEAGMVFRSTRPQLYIKEQKILKKS